MEKRSDAGRTPNNVIVLESNREGHRDFRNSHTGTTSWRYSQGGPLDCGEGPSGTWHIKLKEM
jgi:hypothetical protein